MDTPKEYNEEELKDLKERQEKAVEVLKELQLVPVAKIAKINIKYEGKDVFADHMFVLFQDVKYIEKKND